MLLLLFKIQIFFSPSKRAEQTGGGQGRFKIMIIKLRFYYVNWVSYVSVAIGCPTFSNENENEKQNWNEEEEIPKGQFVRCDSANERHLAAFLAFYTINLRMKIPFQSFEFCCFQKSSFISLSHSLSHWNFVDDYYYYYEQSLLLSFVWYCCHVGTESLCRQPHFRGDLCSVWCWAEYEKWQFMGAAMSTSQHYTITIHIHTYIY